MIRIMDQNFADPDIAANTFVSSEQTAFPVTNLYNKQRRSKVWRTQGYWIVESGSNTIEFEETASTPLTATIAVGAYTSDTTFFTAIKNALETAGGSVYTISRDVSTLKIKITSDGAGGGGILNLLWTDPNSTDMAAKLGFDDSADDTGALSYTAELLVVHDEEWIKIDFGISTNPQAFILVGARNQPLKITPTATIKLQGNETDVWTSPSFEQTLDYDSRAIISFNSQGLHTEALRYWRLLIIDQENPNGYIEAGAIFLGDFYVTERGNVQFGFQMLPVDRSSTVFSEGGQTFSDIREKTERFNLQWRGLTVSERERFLDIFDDVGTSVPFFISMDPELAYSTSTQVMLRYVKFETEPQFRIVSPSNFEMSMQLREEL